MKVKLTVSVSQTEVIEITEQDLEGTTLEEFCEDWIETMVASHLDTGWEAVEP